MISKLTYYFTLDEIIKYIKNKRYTFFLHIFFFISIIILMSLPMSIRDIVVAII